MGHDTDSLWETPIVLAATPIGNLGDATERLRRLLLTAEIVAAEDTRRTRHLCQALGISAPGRFLSLHEHNEASRSAEVVAVAAEGTTVLVVSDAGMPAVSDPGFRLVGAAIAEEAPGRAVAIQEVQVEGMGQHPLLPIQALD